MEFIRNFWNDEEGQGMVEYGLILALVALAAIVVLRTLGGDINAIFEGASDGLEGALP